VDRVIFRKWKNGDIIALLLDNEANTGMMDMYEHVGQHGEGDPQKVIATTAPAQPNEYVALLEELKSIGYELRVIKRRAKGAK